MDTNETDELEVSQAIREALTRGEWLGMSEKQKTMFLDGIVKMIQDNGFYGVTSASVRGRYELVMEHLMPTDLETLINMPEEELAALASKDEE